MTSWTQPQCERCWATHESTGGIPGVRAPESVRLPVRFRPEVRSAEPEQCAWCGFPTWAGIYRRADPATLAFPADDEPEPAPRHTDRFTTP